MLPGVEPCDRPHPRRRVVILRRRPIPALVELADRSVRHRHCSTGRHPHSTMRAAGELRCGSDGPWRVTSWVDLWPIRASGVSLRREAGESLAWPRVGVGNPSGSGNPVVGIAAWASCSPGSRAGSTQPRQPSRRGRSTGGALARSGHRTRQSEPRPWIRRRSQGMGTTAASMMRSITRAASACRATCTWSLNGRSARSPDDVGTRESTTVIPRV